MRKHIPIIALAFMLVLPGMASAVYFNSVTGTADCNGWNADVGITFRSSARLVRLDYVVVLTDAAGTEVDRFEYSANVDIPTETSMVYSFGEAWTSTLSDGDFSMTFDAVLYDIFPDGQNRFEDGFTAGFQCGGDTGGGEGGDDPIVTDFCPRGSGYWKNPAADWPVTNLDLGSDNLDQAALMNILNAPARGDATVILARILIAAKLNMAAGAGNGAADVIADADAFLSEHPVFSDPGKADRKTALTFMDELGEYNSGDCEDDADLSGDTLAPAAGKYDAVGFDKAASVEVMSIGSLKALYR
ncbi:MAG: hypothetical protein ABFS42_12740 [Candidatus Krumholzibacteriota bacterium]